MGDTQPCWAALFQVSAPLTLTFLSALEHVTVTVSKLHWQGNDIPPNRGHRHAAAELCSKHTFSHLLCRLSKKKSDFCPKFCFNWTISEIDDGKQKAHVMILFGFIAKRLTLLLSCLQYYEMPPPPPKPHGDGCSSLITSSAAGHLLSSALRTSLNLFVLLGRILCNFIIAD